MTAASHTNLSREQRLAWARGILAEHDQHSDARVRRACKTILNDAPSYEALELLKAKVLLDALEPATQSKEATS